MKIFKAGYYIFIGLIAIVGILLVISTFEIPGNFKVMTVLSGSMEPAIKTGSIIVVKPVDEYKIGDVITFGPETRIKTPTTHRIIDMRVTEGVLSYITQGDTNNAPDRKEILQKEIIGKVLFSIPYAGYAVNSARKPIGFALLIIIPALIIIYDQGRNIYSEIKKKKNDKTID